MSQKTIGITFGNANSGSPELYVAIEPGSEWAAILLPQGSAYTDSIIDLPTAAQQQVYFLFAQSAPQKIQEFINLYRPYLASFRSSSTNANLTMAWINCPGDITTTNQPINPGPPDPGNTVVINFVQNISGNFIVGQPFNITIGNGFGTLTIINNTPVSFSPADAPDTLQLSYTPGNPNMSFANKTIGTNSLFNNSISIPFSGSGTSGFRFPLGLNPMSLKTLWSRVIIASRSLRSFCVSSHFLLFSLIASTSGARTGSLSSRSRCIQYKAVVRGILISGKRSGSQVADIAA